MQRHHKWEGEVAIGRRDGRQTTGWLVINAIYSPSGELSNFVTVVTDLSQIRAHEEEIRKLSQVVEQSPASIMIPSPAARIEHVNTELSRVTGQVSQGINS